MQGFTPLSSLFRWYGVDERWREGTATPGQGAANGHKKNPLAKAQAGFASL
jgi:hypothetical protein